MYAIDYVVPVKEFVVNTNKKYPPWITAELAQQYRKRDALRRRYTRTQDRKLQRQYLQFSSHVERITVQARSEYLESRISEALHSKKNIWKELRSLQLLPATKDDLHGFTPDELKTLTLRRCRSLRARVRKRWRE